MNAMEYKTLPSKDASTCPTCGGEIRKARNAALYPCYHCRVYWRKPASNSRFKAGSGSYICQECGKHTRDTGNGEGSLGLCKKCLVKAETENSILDGDNQIEN